MEWSKLAIDILIETYSKEKCLYNSKSPSYHNKHSRKEALERISDGLKEVRPSSSADIISKMKSLRTTYVNELNKIKNTMKSGVGTSEIYTPSIWYFEKMSFLRDYVQPRRGTSSADVYHSRPAVDMNDADDSQIIEIASVPFNVEDGEWEVLQDVGHSSEPVQSPNTPSTSGVAKKGQKRKNSYDVEEENELLNRANNILNSVTKAPSAKTELEALGAFVTAALQEVKSKALVLKAKKEILNIIMSVQEEELTQNQ